MYYISSKPIEKNDCFFVGDSNISVSAEFIDNPENNAIYIGKNLNREIMNMRKKMGLIPSNEALIEYKIIQSNKTFDMVLNEQEKYLKPHYKELIYQFYTINNKFKRFYEKSVSIDDCEIFIKLNY